VSDMARIEDDRSPAEAEAGEEPGGEVRAQGTEATVPPDDGSDQPDHGIDRDAPGAGIVRDEPPAEPTEPG
jgi:hypothetical protein